MQEKHQNADCPVAGAVEWFIFGDIQYVARVIEVLKDLNIKKLRTAFSWADWERPNGPEWFDFFIGELNKAGLELLPTLFYTPTQKAVTKPDGSKKTSHPPQRLYDFTDFTKQMIERYGHMFSWIMLWNEPNWKVYWDQEIDPEGSIFAEMVEPAIDLSHSLQKRVVLGGLTPIETTWVYTMLNLGVLQKADAVALHASPGSWFYRANHGWRGWENEIAEVREVLNRFDSHPEIWITETGASTWGRGFDSEIRKQFQIEYFENLHHVPSESIWWYSLFDQSSDHPTDDVLNVGGEADVVAYHFGLIDQQGKKKPLYDHWKEFYSE